jgi:hypothetical protein
MLKSLTGSLTLGLLLAAIFAAPASAFIEKRHFDRYYGTRALEVADPSGGPIAPYEPAQSNLEEDFEVEWNGYKITAVQGFGIEALVLGRKDYTEGDLGALLPIDLALAWGKVSDPAWVKHLRVEQSDRVYRWSYPRGTNLDTETVETFSANMHIMPATPEIAKQMASVARGDVVRMSGFLVDIVKPPSPGEEGFSMLTSRVRTDTGLGACEIILVTSVEIEGR